jgi:dihydrodipicolinate synthase/N-acetylneuraminate lyase
MTKDFKLDLARSTDVTRWWVENGLGTGESPLKTSAAMGEGPDLSDDEWPHLLRTVVNAAGSGAAVICALKPKNTLHTIEDAKRAQDLGATGLQIDLPFFHHPHQDDLVRFYTDISDAIEIGIMIYNTFWFCQDADKESMRPETMLRLKDAEHVVALKWNVPEGQDYDGMRKFSDVFNVIDNSGQAVRCHKNGGRGYISSLVAVNPQHDLAIWKLLKARRYDEAQAKIDRVSAALGLWQAKAGARSGGYRQIKGLMAAIGQSVGPPRPPTLPIDDGELAEATEALRQIGWPVAQEVGAAAAAVAG